MYKTVNGMVPNYLSNKFFPISTVHEHNLRGSNHKLFVPRPLTESLKKSFSYRGATLWSFLNKDVNQKRNFSGSPRLAVKRRKDCKNVSVDKFLNNSK